MKNIKDKTASDLHLIMNVFSDGSIFRMTNIFLGVYGCGMNRVHPDHSHIEKDEIVSTNTNLCQSQILTDTAESNVDQYTKSVHLILEDGESFNKNGRSKNSIRNEDMSNETSDSPMIGNEELSSVKSINKKLDCFEKRFDRIERAIFLLTEYITK